MTGLLAGLKLSWGGEVTPPQAPSRLADINLEGTFGAGLPRAEALSVTALAKQLCTVTNTLTSETASAVSVNVANLS